MNRSRMTFAPGTRVSINLPADHALFTTRWFPAFGEVTTGTVQKAFKNGTVAIAIDQLRNTSADGCRTLHIKAEHLTEVN